MGSEMKPIRMWAVVTDNSEIGLYVRLEDARNDARDLREHWGEKPTIVRGQFIPDQAIKRRGRKS